MARLDRRHAQKRYFHTFLNDLEGVFVGASPPPNEDLMGTFRRARIQKSVATRDIVTYYSRLDVGHEDTNYNFFASSARKHLKLQRRSKTSQGMQASLADARHNNNPTSD